MKLQKLGLAFYVIGVLVMAADVIYGKQIQGEVATLGLQGIEAQSGRPGVLKVLLFAFGYPLGVSISLLGAALFGGMAAGRLGRFGGLVLFAALAPLLSPGILGTQHSPVYFGIGGLTILLLTALAMWFWGRYRRRVSAALRPAVDWQGLGILAFALAAWNLCGFGGMPSFAVYPEKMIALNAVPFAVGQLKAVMALFILGFAFTAFGLRRAAQVVR